MIETPAPPAVETDAAYLRRAAALIRQRATAASPGPWISQKFFHSGGLVAYNIESRHPDHMSHVGSAEEVSDLVYIALTHPPLGLALADWLDAEADCQEQCTAAAEGVRDLLAASTGADHRLYVSASTLDQALNVARIVLGEAA